VSDPHADHTARHTQSDLAGLFQPAGGDLLRVRSRRWFLQTGLMGLGGLTLPQLLQARAGAAENATANNHKTVILFWLSGGPSQLDMWDPQAERAARSAGTVCTD
jgi:hypothetical protein